MSLEGRYVILQKDNKGLDETQWQLHVGDFAAFGEYTAKNTGKYSYVQYKSNSAHCLIAYFQMRQHLLVVSPVSDGE